MNETYPDLVPYNGIYLPVSLDDRGRQVYKHEFRDAYLYYIGGNLLPGFWAVGDHVGGTEALFSVQTNEAFPVHAPREWEFWDSQDGHWVHDSRLRAVCVPPDFVTCTTGRVRLGRLSPWNSHQESRMGEYVLTNQTYSMRPVYQHADNEEFLYYFSGLWMVGPNVGTVAGAMFVLDFAWRPEYIVEEWVVFNGRQFVRDQQLRATCAGL